jgi:hypothetical protein
MVAPSGGKTMIGLRLDHIKQGFPVLLKPAGGSTHIIQLLNEISHSLNSKIREVFGGKNMTVNGYMSSC